MVLRAFVEIKMMMHDDETEDQADTRLYDAMYEGLCCQSSNHIEFWVENSYVEE